MIHKIHKVPKPTKGYSIDEWLSLYVQNRVVGLGYSDTQLLAGRQLASCYRQRFSPVILFHVSTNKKMPSASKIIIWKA